MQKSLHEAGRNKKRHVKRGMSLWEGGMPFLCVRAEKSKCLTLFLEISGRGDSVPSNTRIFQGGCSGEPQLS